MKEDIIDLPEVLERIQNDHELLAELLEIFMEDCPKKMQTLRAALQRKDAAYVGEIAHSVKGASGNISVKPLYSRFLKIEELAKGNQLDSIPPILTEIEGYFQELVTYSAQLKKEFKK